ncbi:MAG: DNA helicase Rep [Gammaproteobacteria bacterium]|nr:DNA helicase Rep [Gammaproteobacteria bacterium]
MAQLNPQQQAAVNHTETPLLVLAGAGSGKTRVITQKIAHLMQSGMAAHHIYAVTFTNKAAKEMKARVGQLLSQQEAKGLSVSTFHTLGLKIFREEGHRLGFQRGFTIMDASDSLAALKELLRDGGAGGLNEEESLRDQIGHWKNDFINPEQALKQASNDEEQYNAKIYQRYQRLLLAYNAVDFDDLITQPLRLLQEHDELREKWQQRVRHLLVDEYQDTNATQYELVKLLVGKLGGLTAVGDDDQSVYAWRGARPENLNLLQQDYPRLKVIKLEQNYRSSRRILHCANQLISKNPHLFEKRLWSDLGIGDPLRIVPCRNAEDEAEWVSSEILSHQFRSGKNYRDYAILYRGNFQSRLFERSLRLRNIPYKVSGGTSFFERSEVKDVIAYLRLLVNPNDDSAFLRIINTPRREIGASTLETLAGYARERENGMLISSLEWGLKSRLSERAAQRLEQFSSWLTQTAERARHEDPLPLVKQLLEEIHYESWLRDQASDPKGAERRLNNVTELLEWIEQLAKKTNNGQQRDLTDIVNRITLMNILDRDSDDDSDNQVQMMTVHAAKGLEFPYVYVIGMEEELMPHRTSIEEDNLEEERRLAYVAITRAQQNLTFSYAKRRRRYGEESRCEPSRFLFELPEEELNWEGKEENPDPEQRLQTGKNHLDGLKALLAKQ